MVRRYPRGEPSGGRRQAERGKFVLASLVGRGVWFAACLWSVSYLHAPLLP